MGWGMLDHVGDSRRQVIGGSHPAVLLAPLVGPVDETNRGRAAGVFAPLSRRSATRPMHAPHALVGKAQIPGDVLEGEAGPPEVFNPGCRSIDLAAVIAQV